MVYRVWGVVALGLLALAGVAIAWRNAPSAPVVAPGRHPNLLVLVADDVGVDKVAAYGAHPHPPRTPNLDALAARGLLFERAYATPTCSPSRAVLLTGRHGRRYGIGSAWSTRDSTAQLPVGERTLAHLVKLAAVPYRAEALGKWHLAGQEGRSGATHPRDLGFDRFEGTLGNLSGYTDWTRWVDDGRSPADRSPGREYATTATVDDALDRMRAMPEPWLLYVGFHAAHTPLERPPPALRRDREPATRAELYDEVLEALDAEIGRLLASADPGLLSRTDIVFLGDNGTPDHAIIEPWDPNRGKLTMFEGGIRVPFIVAGPDVAAPGRRVGGLVHLVDLFPTVAELLGVPVERVVDRRGRPVALDGTSFLGALRERDGVPPRQLVFTENFGPNGPPPWRLYTSAVLDGRYKLVTRGQREQLYALGDPPAGLEGPPLIGPEPLPAEAQEARDHLAAARDALYLSTPFDPGGSP